jgi:hypothetical protein
MLSYTQPNPKGNANGFNNPNNPNNPNTNPVPIKGVEYLILTGGLLGSLVIYRNKKRKLNNDV